MKIEGNVSGVEIDIDPSTSTDNLRIVVIGEENKITIGANCKIAGHIFVANGSSLVIGDKLKCTGRVIFHLHEGSEVKIGNNCLMAMEVAFRPSDAHKIIDVSNDQRINEPIPINVSDSVWIGEGCLLLKGAEIPPESIVGARSVVSKSFTEKNSLIAGYPAKLIRTGVRWEP